MRRYLNQYGHKSEAEQRAERHLTETAPTLATSGNQGPQPLGTLRPEPGGPVEA